MSMLIVVTGDGKGKTTSALGQALRVIGEGGRAVMYQFIKGPWISGEDIIISKIKNKKLNIKNKKHKENITYLIWKFEIFCNAETIPVAVNI